MFRMETLRRAPMINAVMRKDDGGGIAKRLEITRRALGYETQSSFAEAVSREIPMSLARWHNYESGYQRLTVDAALALCARFDVTLDWLYRGKRGDLPARIVKAIEAVEAADRGGGVPDDKRERPLFGE